MKTYIHNVRLHEICPLPLPLPSMGFSVNTRRPKIAKLEGRDHYVVPVVMAIGNSVMYGSRGPLFYPADELDRSASMWNGRPILIHHPNDYSTTPEVFNASKVGILFNARFSGSKLMADAWIDVERLTAVDHYLAESVRSGRPVEVSTGLYTDHEYTEGDWNGQHYVGVARNYRPDHLALLPDLRGACSLADGCGLSAVMNSAEDPLPLPIVSGGKNLWT